jgi:hypothetical protein
MNMQTIHACRVRGAPLPGAKPKRGRKAPAIAVGRVAGGTTHSLPKPTAAPKLIAAENLMTSRKTAVSRDYEPVPGQWYENLEEEESFRVLSVDEDSELVEIEYLDGDIEEIDIEAWHEMDLEHTDEPEGWSEPEEDEEEDEDDEDFDEDDEDDDDDDDDFDDDEDEAEEER